MHGKYTAPYKRRSVTASIGGESGIWGTRKVEEDGVGL